MEQFGMGIPQTVPNCKDINHFWGKKSENTLIFQCYNMA